MSLYERCREAGVDCWDPIAVSTVAGMDVGADLPLLHALSIADRESRFVVPRLEAVVSIPDSAFPVRRTRSVIESLLSEARSEVLIAGYQVSDPAVILTLGEATSRGVRVDFFVDAKQGSLEHLRARWPRGAQDAHVWVGDLRTAKARKASMHAKAVVIDGVRAFVSSANLTRNGLDSNIEVGVLVEGPAVLAVRALFARLTSSEQFRREIVSAPPIGTG